jgi:tryptophan-rich hypothetical protein
LTRLERSKWTSTEPRRGWRHFEVVAVRGAGAGAEVELRASVHRQTVVFVMLRELLDRRYFRPGWHALPLPDELGGVN